MHSRGASRSGRTVAVDARPLLEPHGGLRRHLSELLPRLRRAEGLRWVLVSPRAMPAVDAAAGMEVVVVPGPLTTLLRPAWEATVLSRALAKLRPDVWFSSTGTVPRGLRCPAVVTVHDVVPVTMPALVSARHRAYWSWTLRRVALARRVLAVSRATAEDVRRHLAVPRSRIVVVPEAPSACFRPVPGPTREATRAELGLPGGFVLALGPDEPRKDLGTLVRAMELVNRGRVAAIPLLVVGRQGRARAAAPPWLRRLPTLGDADLARLMAAALVLAMPSRHEGFGLPVLEAMASGCPVVASHAGAIPEVAGGAAALVPPEDPAAWAAALAEVLEAPRVAQAMRARGLRRAARFTWDDAARATARAIRTVTRAPLP